MTKKPTSKSVKKAIKKPAPKRTPNKKKATKQQRKHPVLRWLLVGSLLMMLVAGLGLLWLDYDVKQRFESHEWVLPARVFSRPESLYVGRQLEAERLQELLKLMRYRYDSKASSPGSYAVGSSRFIIHTRGFDDTDGGEKPQKITVELGNKTITALKDAQGRALSIVRLEPLQIGSIHPGSQEDRVFVKLDEVPPLLITFLLDTEDRSFYNHHGISPKGLMRALYVDITSRRLAQGGSTLTQQLVKNLWLTQRRSIWRKLVEIPTALLLELHYNKDELLEAYLNEVYLGQDGSRAIRGMGLGAQFYFGRPLNELSPPELAMLVGLLKGPSLYDPRRKPDLAQTRRNQVLRNAVEQGNLTEAEYQKYAKQDMAVVPKNRTALYAFPAFVDLVKRQLERDYSSRELLRSGLKIQSTLDVLDQLAAEKALSGFLSKRDAKLNGAVVLVSPNQGDVLALVGDKAPRRAGFNRALDAKRTIGSLAKPFVVMAALESDEFTLAELVPDEPITVDLGGGKTWSPENYERDSLGDMPLLDALTHSRNQAIAQVGVYLRVSTVVNTMLRMGVNAKIPQYPSVLLGGFELTPLQVAMLYQPLANYGFQTSLRSITDVLDQDGQPLARYPASSNQVIDPQTAYQTTWALQKVMSEGTGRYAHNILPELTLAGKTGTSNDLRDSWFAGFSGSSLAVVWIGKDDNTPTGLTGASGALRVWTDVMAGTAQQPLTMPMPEGLEEVWISADGLSVSSSSCVDARLYVLKVDKIPTQFDHCGKITLKGTQQGSSLQNKKEKKGVKGWLKGLFGQ